eukprot:gnl/TRDRNA2_/TRDRNA2_169405_c2_seq1.p1 gnl/TRDRNA2_/TRDRNA2_169405_c2~~gnl/TRDRNA2_/TRDRNA2_169405_c2_seq1.p1  ORF type:complete len:523 (+),score=89.49 gnl/TRDRNA2_/TRDRNA2_169405_c2_seq1:228-1571(+)
MELDLKYRVRLVGDGSSVEVRDSASSEAPRRPSEGDVVILSACRNEAGDSSVETGMKNVSAAFKAVIAKDPRASYYQVLSEMRRLLHAHGQHQLAPQLCSEHFLNLTSCFMPESEPVDVGPPAPLRPPARRAVSIAFGCLERPGAEGCISECEAVVDILREVFAFHDNQIRRLRDDDPNQMPTKANVMAALGWLVRDAEPGDELFLHYCRRKDEVDPHKMSFDQKKALFEGAPREVKADSDEAVDPKEAEGAAQELSPEEMYSAILADLPRGCRMWVLMDDHRGRFELDLPFRARLTTDGLAATCTLSSSMQRTATCAEVIQISACKEASEEASEAEASAPHLGLSGAFSQVLGQMPEVSCKDLLHGMQQCILQNRVNLVPVMSSKQFVQLDSCFVRYGAKRVVRHRPRPSSPGPVLPHFAAGGSGGGSPPMLGSAWSAPVCGLASS